MRSSHQSIINSIANKNKNEPLVINKTEKRRNSFSSNINRRIEQITDYYERKRQLSKVIRKRAKQ